MPTAPRPGAVAMAAMGAWREDSIGRFSPINWLDEPAPGRPKPVQHPLGGQHRYADAWGFKVWRGGGRIQRSREPESRACFTSRLQIHRLRSSAPHGLI